ncbi:MAG: hypothetical protein ACRD3J_17350 [Thermoanaerobaculia bacterium]
MTTSRFTARLLTIMGGIAVALLFALLGALPTLDLGAQGYSNATPTISSAFGTAPSVTAGKVSSFRVNVGTGGAATGGVIAMNFTAPTGWNCQVSDVTAAAANVADFTDRMVSSTSTTVTVRHNTVSTGAVLVYTASDILELTCVPY